MLFISHIMWYPSKLVNCVIISGGTGEAGPKHLGLREPKTKEKYVCYLGYNVYFWHLYF